MEKGIANAIERTMQTGGLRTRKRQAIRSRSQVIGIFKISADFRVHESSLAECSIGALAVSADVQAFARRIMKKCCELGFPEIRGWQIHKCVFSFFRIFFTSEP